MWPQAAEQRCWNHKLRNVVDAVPLTQQPDVLAAMQHLGAADSVADAQHERQRGVDGPGGHHGEDRILDGALEREALEGEAIAGAVLPIAPRHAYRRTLP